MSFCVISLHQDAEGPESPQRSGSAGERLPSEGENDDDMPEGMHELRSLVELTVTEQIQQVPGFLKIESVMQGIAI